MPTKRLPRIHPPGRPILDPETVRRVVGCPICHVAAGEFCLRIRRQGREPMIRHRNHQVRVTAAKKELGRG